MIYIRKAEDRGVANLGWLHSKHSFSFGSYYDKNHMGVSALRVINDDMVMPGTGFGEHPHRDMEIISYVIEGELKHQDSTGNDYIVPAGDIQRMSAGKGVSHSEFNPSATDKVKFLQIWIEPNVFGIEPSYEQKRIEQNGPLTTLITPNGANGTMSINQDATLSRVVLQPQDSITLSTDNRIGYLHLVKGELTVDEHKFSAGDAFAVEPHKAHTLVADATVEALWFDLPPVQ